jgi:hypothetical protein
MRIVHTLRKPTTMPTKLAKESELVSCSLTDNYHSGQYYSFTDMFSSNNSYIKKIKHDTDGKKMIIDSCLVLYFLLVNKVIIRNGEYKICGYY